MERVAKSAVEASQPESAGVATVETPKARAGGYLANDIEQTIDMVNELGIALQDGGDGYEGSAFAGFGMVIIGRLRVALDKYEKAAQRADA